MPGEVTLTHQIGKEFMPVTGGSQVAYVLLEAKPTEIMAQVRMPFSFSSTRIACANPIIPRFAAWYAAPEMSGTMPEIDAT